MKRSRRALLLLLVLTAAAACYRTTRTATTPPQTISSMEHWQKGMGVVLASGRKIELKRTPELIGDSLLIVQSEVTMPRRRTITDTLRIADVTHVTVRKFSAGRTIGMAIGVPVLALGILLAIAAASSCPFIYAYDGAAFIPVAEPLGGAVSAGLARTDLSELEQLVLADGRYRLIIANEMDETQHLDAFGLVAVDHPRGTTVIADRQGGLHVAGPPLAPLSATSTRADVLPLLSRPDGRWWPGDDARFRAGHTRDTLTLTFPRPAHDAARLVLHARTSALAAQVLKSMLDLWGGEVDTWYAMLDGSPATRAANEEWVLREELWALRVWVQERTGWVAQDVAIGGGPYLAELQAIPLDLSRVEGTTVTLRLHPPAGYWDVDFAALDTLRAGPPLITELAISEAEPVAGQDTRALLAAADGSFLVMATRGERIEMSFAAQPPPAGLERTVFSRTTGFYRINTDRSGARHAAVLDSLWLQPGYPVHFAERVQRTLERSAAR